MKTLLLFLAGLPLVPIHFCSDPELTKDFWNHPSFVESFMEVMVSEVKSNPK